MRRAILAGIVLAIVGCSPAGRSRTAELSNTAEDRPAPRDDSPLTKPARNIDMH